MDNGVEEDRKRWTDVVKYNMEDLRLTVNTGNRAEWRRTRVADPSPEGFTA